MVRKTNGRDRSEVRLCGSRDRACIPFFPDTISVYAFAVLEESYWKFAVATFVGSLGRLLLTLGVFGGAVSLF